MSNHLSVRIYPNKQVVCNVVAEEDLDNHIEYNKTFRFGCLLYIDGTRVSDGCLKQEVLSDYDTFYKDWYSRIRVNVNLNKVTRPVYL